jgi:[glutamine synthetase] adenylyltransferase / [glutamine synthetase]-adenylyl-L-tyrosine phosphorylase
LSDTSDLGANVAISPSDLFLSADLTAEQARRYLESFGFEDPGAADTRLQSLAEDVQVREALATLAATLLEALRQTPDPDAGLSAFVRYVDASPARTTLLRYFADDPRVLGVLVDVTATAPFATELLVRNPEFLHWLVGEIHRTPPDATDLADEATSALVAFADPVARLDSLKRFQRRELLRIAGREAIGRATAADTARHLSLLAETTVDLVLSEAIRRVPSATGAALVVVAVGPLAARQLDYGTILDVAIIGDDAQAHRAAGIGRLEAVAARLVADLADDSSEGAFYELRQPFVGPNVPSPLIPEGQWRTLVSSGALERYGAGRVRVVAGDAALAARISRALTSG